MKKTKLNKKSVMPSDDDIRKMSNGLSERIKNLTNDMIADGVNARDGLELISLSLVYFIMFNRKRAGIYSFIIVRSVWLQPLWLQPF